MAEKKRKRIVKPKEVKEDKQTVDGLNLSFEEAMQFLSKPEIKIKKPK